MPYFIFKKNLSNPHTVLGFEGTHVTSSVRAHIKYNIQDKHIILNINNMGFFDEDVDELIEFLQAAKATFIKNND